MKRHISKLATSIVGAVAFLGVSANVAQADSFYSSAPIPPSLAAFANTENRPQTWYVNTSVKGIQFYGANPFYSQQTPDGNLFVNGIVLMQSQEGTVSGSYIQIDCGRRMYRDLVPYLILTPNGYEYTHEPRTYNWIYFRTGSVFEIVGSQYCQQAARSRQSF